MRCRLTPEIRELSAQGNVERAVACLLHARESLQLEAPYLPTHDRQRYEGEMSALQHALPQPRRTFRFHRTPATSTESAPAAPTAGSSGAANPPDTPAPPPPPPPGGALSGRRHEVLTLPASGHAVHARDLDACMLNVGDVQGSVFLEACTRCVVVGTAAQVRLTRCDRTVVAMDTRTPVTLEGCTHMHIGTYVQWQSGAVPATAAVRDFDDVLGERLHWQPLAPALAAQLRAHAQDPAALATLL